MAVVLGTGFVLSAEDEIPGTPWIGWHTVLQESPNNVSATTNFDDAVLLANPSTNLKWVGTTATEQVIVVSTFTYGGVVDYMGVARHNFGTAGIAVSVEALTTNPATDSQTRLLLHFDDAGLSPDVFIDSSPNAHVFTNSGNTFHDTGTKKFGIASGFFDGTGDFISTPDHADFNLGTNDWVYDCWIKYDGADGTIHGIVAQEGAGAATSSFSLRRRSDNHHIQFDVSDGATTTSLTSTSTINTASNTGWNHIAVGRSGNTLFFAFNGVVEDTNAFTGTIPDSAADFTIGARGAQVWDGWIDEARLSVGTDRGWSTDFTPPTIAHPWVQLTSPAVPADDSPLMFRFDPAAYYAVQLRMAAGSEPPEAAVMYVGELLVCERSIDINVEHVPVTYGRRTHVVNGMSQSGEFLGRIVIGEHRATKAEFKWFQDTWWRENFDPFLEAAQSIPFFWAWSPEEYPAECGYVWLTNDAEASVDTVTRRVHTELVMEGVA